MSQLAQKARHAGKITYINPRGVAYISSAAGDFGFTFDKIANYSGQSVRELNLRTGSDVMFDEDDGKVSSVQITENSAGA